MKLSRISVTDKRVSRTRGFVSQATPRSDNHSTHFTLPNLGPSLSVLRKRYCTRGLRAILGSKPFTAFQGKTCNCVILFKAERAGRSKGSGSFCTLPAGLHHTYVITGHARRFRKDPIVKKSGNCCDRTFHDLFPSWKPLDQCTEQTR